mgnify:CR=1 FL=1
MESDNRDSFIFYKSFQQAIDEAPEEEQLAIYRAISYYALYKTEPSLTGLAKVAWVLIKPQLDANWRRYENGCKGGAPKGNKNNRYSRDTTKVQPKYNRDTTKIQPNVNDNDNVNDNKNDGITKAELSVSPQSDEFKRFNDWLKKTCPYVLKVSTQMTEEEYYKLLKTYTKEELCDAVQNLNNWKDFPRKRTNVYRSTLDELKKKREVRG